MEIETLEVVPRGTGCASPAIIPEDVSALIGREPESALVVPPILRVSALQPVTDVAAYLKKRTPVRHFEAELPLFNALPEDVRNEVESLLSAFADVEQLRKPPLKFSVQRACRTIVAAHGNIWRIKTFRANFDALIKCQDWVCLVNRCKAGLAWQDKEVGLPDEFINYCAGRVGSYVREDAVREALRSIRKQWRTGKDRRSKPAPIAGYGFWQEWFQRGGYRVLNLPRRPLPEEAPYPPGWSPSNIARQINARNALPRAARDFLLQGSAAARASIPRVHMTRKHLRFMERVQFDDVKVDWRIFNTATGQPEDLWLIVAHDVATSVLLGFGMRSASVREDGSQQHLTRHDMKQILAYVLERFGLPPYLMTWTVENGAATVSEGTQRALESLLRGRVRFHFTGMIGGKSPRGYAERRTGNAAGKASLESHNRLDHIIGADLPGQVGPHYGKRPQDIAAREKEAVATWKLAQFLPENLRDQVGYGLLTKPEAREELFRIFGLRNNRIDHNLEGFREMLEWYNPATGKMCPRNTCPEVLPPGARIERRKESPIERAGRLVMEACQPLPDGTPAPGWQACSPDILTVLLESTQRRERIEKDGLIKISIDGRTVEYVAPDPNNQHALLVPGNYVLAYANEEDPAYLHLTDGDARILGTWVRRSLVTDSNSLSEAIRCSTTAFNAAKAKAEELAAPYVAAENEVRRMNEEIFNAHDCYALAAASAAPKSRPVESPAATGLVASRKAVKRAAQIKVDRTAAAREALRKAQF